MADIGAGMLLMLTGVGMLAGFVDSIAGGGGMITIPALLFAGLPPHYALGTNKFQSSFGSFSATWHFYKKGYLNIKESTLFVASVFIFSTFGTLAVQFCNATFLQKFIPVFLVVFALYFLFSPKISEEDSKTRVGRIALAFVLGIVGFYDGFFGPGAGSFFMLVMVVLGGFGLTKGLAHARLFNFSTNIASLIMFAIGGYIIPYIGLCMAFGAFVGANLGSRVAIRCGVKIIKPFVVIISIVMSINLLRQYL